MNRKICIFSLLLIFSCTFCFSFSETNGQLRNREQGWTREWNSLCEMCSNLSGESYINLRNYMMGFSDAAYQLYEYLYSLYNDNYYYKQYIFYYEQSQSAIKKYGARTSGFRSYYYNAGADRIDKAGRRFSFYDF